MKYIAEEFEAEQRNGRRGGEIRGRRGKKALYGMKVRRKESRKRKLSFIKERRRREENIVSKKRRGSEKKRK